MMVEVFENYLAKVKSLPSEDRSESKIVGNVIRKYGAVNVLDYSGSEGEGNSKLTIEVEFANLIDFSRAKIDELKIVGKANIVNLHKARIRKLDLSELEVVYVNMSESNIHVDMSERDIIETVL